MVGFLTGQHAEAVLTILVLEGCRVRGGQHAVLILLGLQFGVARLVVVGFERPVAAVLVEAHFSSVVGLQRQLLDRFPLQVDATVELVLLRPLVVVLGCSTRVGVGVFRNPYEVGSVFVVGGRPRQDGHAGEGRVRIVEALHGHVLTIEVAHVHTYASVQILVNLVVGVDTGLDTLEVNSVEHTLVVVV